MQKITCTTSCPCLCSPTTYLFKFHTRNPCNVVHTITLRKGNHHKRCVIARNAENKLDANFIINITWFMSTLSLLNYKVSREMFNLRVCASKVYTLLTRAWKRGNCGLAAFDIKLCNATIDVFNLCTYHGCGGTMHSPCASSLFILQSHSPDNCIKKASGGKFTS